MWCLYTAVTGGCLRATSHRSMTTRRHTYTSRLGLHIPGVRHSTAVANLSRHLLELCGWFCFVFARRSCFSHRRVTISPRPSPLCLSYGLAARWNLAVLLELSLFLLSLQLAKIFTEVQPPLPGRAASCGSFAHDVDPSGPLRPGV